jgi:hypothetical protein
MHGIGLREIVALGVLLVAGTIGFMFLDPTASEGGGRPAGTVSLGETPPTGTPTPKATPTPLPDAVKIDPPMRWRVTYFDRFFSGGFGQVADGARDGVLLIEHDGPPFSDMRDDGWKVEASVIVALEPGRWGFTLEYDCELVVTVGGEEVAAAENPDGPATVEVTFMHGGGQAGLVIACEDTGGPTLLRWVE